MTAMPLARRAYVALGANIGQPLVALRSAVDELSRLRDTRLAACSSFYRTAPVGVANQPDFINAVVALDTTLDADELLQALFDIEARHGRRRDTHLAPRTLDLDLLMYADMRSDAAHMILPHPRMHLRAFVLAPLLEIAPEVVIPGKGAAAEWLARIGDQPIARMETA